MPKLTSDKDKLRSLKRPFWFSLLLISHILSTTLFGISYRKYTTWYRTTRPQNRENDLILHTTFFIATCAPLCSILGIIVSAAYYWRKRRKYGKYDIAMRRKGRGYCIDPSDAVDLRMLDEARRANAVKKGNGAVAKKKEEDVEQGRGMLKPFSWVAGGEQRTATQEVTDTQPTAKRVSLFSHPYGWGRKEEETGKEAECDSVKKREQEARKKKAVADIWLRSGTEGRNNGKARWDEGMEKGSLRNTS
jgi:hypothetical protein